MQAYVDWIYRWRYIIVVSTLLLVILMAYGGRNHEQNFKTDYRNFFSAENPQLLSFEALQNIYTKNDNVLIVLAPKDGDVFTHKTLRAVERLSHPADDLSAWRIPYASRVDSIANYQHTSADGDDLWVRDLVRNASTLTASQLEDIKRVALNEPLLVNRLITAKANVTGINITVELPGKSNKEVTQAARYSRELVEKIKTAYPDIDVYLTGMIMMNNAFPEASKKDWGSLIPVMYLVIAIVMALLIRGISGTIATLVVIMFSIFSAMGLAGWLEIWLTAPSAAAPTMIMTLAVADCVHILVTLYNSMREGQDKRAAMVESLRVNLQPVFLTSLTTVIGFLSMNFSDAPPFRDLGNITAMGVALAFVLAVVFLPALMLILPIHVHKSESRTGRAMDSVAEFVIARHNVILWSGAAIVLFLAAFIPRIELNDEFVKYFDKSVEFRQHTDFVMENLTGIYSVSYSLSAGEAGGINDPDYMRQVEKFANWYRQQPNVLHVNVITDIMKRLNKNMNGDDPDYYRLPVERDLTAQYLLLYEMSLPFGLALDNIIDIDKSATRMTVTLENMDNIRIRALEKRAQEWLKRNPPVMADRGASPTIMFSYIAERNIKNMLIGTAVAIILIAVVMMIALRSVKYGLLSLVPNFVPAIAGFGLWAIFVGQVGLALSVVSVMTLGIVVDDTVHFISKYLRARRDKGLSAEDSVRYAFSTVGTALWVTTVTLVAGFFILSTSAFELNQGMGQLTAIVISLALLADMTLLPALLMKFEEKKHATSKTSDDRVGVTGGTSA